MKKVLFLTYAYPPLKFPRSIQISHLVQYLRKKFCLNVICFEPKKDGDQSLLTFTQLDNVIYAKSSFLTSFLEDSRGFVVKNALLPDLNYPWHFDLFNKAVSTINSNGTDIIVTFGQPMSTHITGLKLKKKYPKIKWIAHFSDPWIDNPFNHHNSLGKYINKYYQDRVFKNADQLIFTSQETVDLVMLKYSKDIVNKTFVLPHCFNSDLYPKNTIKNPTFTVRYLGNFYGHRQPDSLFKAMNQSPLKELENFKIELIGASTNSLVEKIYEYKLEDKVFLKSSVDYISSLQLMKESDLLLIIDAPAKMSPFLPSKLIDYIGANKPIFGITPKGTAKKLIEQMNFLTADPENIVEIALKLYAAINKVKNSQSIISHDIYNLYTQKIVGEHMIKIINSLYSIFPEN